MANGFDVTVKSDLLTSTLLTTPAITSNLTTDCNIWDTNSATTSYSRYASGPVHFATSKPSGNINIGPFTGASSANINIGTSSDLSGDITIGSYSALGKLLFNTPTTEVLAQPTTTNGIVNKSYADGKITTLLAGTNIWTGTSNKFNNQIYASTISPLTSSANLSIGGSLSPNTFIQNADGLAIGTDPSSSYNPTIVGTMAGQGMKLANNGTSSLIDMFSSDASGNNGASSRIYSVGGTSARNSGTLNIQSGTISMEPGGSSTIGSSSTVRNYIRNTTNLIIGANPSTYAPVGNTLVGNGASIYTKDNYSIFDMYSSGNIGQNNTSSRIYSSGGTSVLNSGALTLTSGTINIEPVGGATIGSATTVNSYIRTTDGLAIGTNPSTYATGSAGMMEGQGMKFANNGTLSLIDMFSSNVAGLNGGSSRIYSQGGTTAQNSGALTISAGTIDITPTANLTLGTATNTNTIGGIRVVGNVLDLKASGTLTIGSATSTSIDIGVAGTTTTTINGAAYTYIKNSTATIIGTNPTSHTTLGKIAGTAIRLYNSSIYSSIDMYSAGADIIPNAYPSSRFISTGGTTDINTGGLAISAGTIELTPATSLTLGTTTNTNTIGGIRVVGNVLDLKASGTLTIGSGNTPNINIGSATTTNTFIRNSDGLIIGNNPTTYLPSDGFMTGSGMRLYTGGNNLIDFHSTTLTGRQDFTARIEVAGGTTQNTGEMTISANTINVNNRLNMKGGLSFGKGNLTNATFIQTGGFGNGSNTYQAYANFTWGPFDWSAMGLVNFGSGNPMVICNNTSVGLTSQRLIISASATATGCAFHCYNPTGTILQNVGTSINYIAIGNY